MPARKRILTESEWRRVFEVRCKAKRGQAVTDEETALFKAALKSDPARYRAEEADVFDATVPAGSMAKARRR